MYTLITPLIIDSESRKQKSLYLKLLVGYFQLDLNVREQRSTKVGVKAGCHLVENR